MKYLSCTFYYDSSNMTGLSTKLLSFYNSISDQYIDKRSVDIYNTQWQNVYDIERVPCMIVKNNIDVMLVDINSTQRVGIKYWTELIDDLLNEEVKREEYLKNGITVNTQLQYLRKE